MAEQKRKKEFKYMAYHYEAIELRYQGKGYDEMAQYLTEKYKKDFKIERLRKWFMTGGILADMYLDYARQENDRRRKFVMEEMKKLLPTIPKTYQEIIERTLPDLTNGQKIYHDSVKRQVLKDLCELFGFKLEPGADGSDPLDEYFDRLEKHAEINPDDDERKTPNVS